MEKKKKSLKISFILLLLCLGVIPLISQSYTRISEESLDILQSSAIDSQCVINLLNDKMMEYGMRGYFPQIYEPSLQATYYALAILDALGELDQIDIIALKDFIMSFYNEQDRLFIDPYVERYINTDLTDNCYPLASLLEINCYAALALDIINELDEISISPMVNFIWSCYNPSTSGFVGEPYSILLPGDSKTSTMDNTYFAIQTLTLLDSWDSHPLIAEDLAEFVATLQETAYSIGIYGGFYNDEDESFRSLGLSEPSVFASYYCVRSLEILGKMNAIDTPLLHTYLIGIYDAVESSFTYGFDTPNSNYNLVATAMALELAQLTACPSINYNATLDFLINNQNLLGIWDQSTILKDYELIDTFQILRSLQNLGEITRFNQSQKDKMVKSLTMFADGKGYSLLSEEYTSLHHFHTMLSAFELYNMVLDFPVKELYEIIENSYMVSTYPTYHSFKAATSMELSYTQFRSRPLEYYCSEENHYKRSYGFDTIYWALSSLNYIYKLPEFNATYGLEMFISEIVASQYLEPGCENYGAFASSQYFTGYPSYQNFTISFEYTYYTLKSLELLDTFLGTNNLIGLGFDLEAVKGYILNQVIENGLELYLKPNNFDNAEDILQATYFGAELLLLLDEFNLDTAKIKSYIINHLNYSNIKNIYYSFKLSNLLGLHVYFEIEDIYNLMQNIYDPFLQEFYLTADQNKIEQEALLWVCDLVKNFRNPSPEDYLPVGGEEFNLMTTLPTILALTIAPSVVIVLSSKKINILKLKKKTP